MHSISLNLLDNMPPFRFFKSTVFSRGTSGPSEPDNSQSVLLPPGPLWSRLFLWFLVSGSFALLIWSIFAKVQDVVVLSGSLRSQHPVAKVLTPLAGRVQEVFVVPSQKVVAGEVLLTLDVSDQKIQLRSLLARVEQLKQSYNSYRRFHADSLMSLQSELSVNQDLLDRYSKLALSGGMSDVQVLSQRNRVVQLETRIAEAIHAMADKSSEFFSQRSQLTAESDLLEQAIQLYYFFSCAGCCPFSAASCSRCFSRFRFRYCRGDSIWFALCSSETSLPVPRCCKARLNSHG